MNATSTAHIPYAKIPTSTPARAAPSPGVLVGIFAYGMWAVLVALDRKSTRLNSSHSQISYAVFCLKQNRSDRKSTRLNSSHRQISYPDFCLKETSSTSNRRSAHPAPSLRLNSPCERHSTPMCAASY